MAASAASSTASLSSSGTPKGSTSSWVEYEPVAGSSGASGNASTAARGWASATAIARARAPSAAARSLPRAAAKPQAPPIRTRTPKPSSSALCASSTRPLRVETLSAAERTWRTSA